MVVQTALEEIPRLMVELCRAVAASDAAPLHRAAHTLSGAVRCFGAQQASGYAVQLESAGRKEDLREAGAILAALEGEIARLTKDLSASLQRD
jgi:HPt (histidine-containing phosphotransfer) domain-containing protein